jgi:hypothetical protein
MESNEQPVVPGAHDITARMQMLLLEELRRARGNAAATKRAFLGYFRQGLAGGLSLETLVEIAALKPTSGTSVIAKVGYNTGEIKPLIQFLKTVRLEDVLRFEDFP